MASRYRQFTRCITGLLLVLGAGIALAQSPEEAAATDADPAVDDSLLSLESTLQFDRPQPLQDGRDPVYVEGPKPPPVQDENDVDFIGRMALISERQGQISDLELQGGGWDADLTKVLQELGELYRQQGTYQEAEDAFERAVQVSRINNGLDSLDQVPLVHELIDSHLAQGEWEKADQYQNYLFYINSKLYGTDDPRMLPVLYDLARWNLRVFNHHYGDAVGMRLMDAYTLFKTATAIVGMHFGKDDERYIAYLKDMAGSAYLVSRNQSLIQDSGRPDYRSAQAMFADRMSQIDPINALGYREGEDALKRVVEHFADREGAEFQYATALVDLGDWYLVFERRRAAEEQYRQAYDLLASLDGGEEKIAETFGQVVPLPSFAGPVGELALQPDYQSMNPDALRSGYADVSVSVNAFGQVSEVTVLTEETPENERIYTLLRRKVRATVFRPPVQDGAMIRSEDSRFRYRYWY